jgi:tripartite-type tricarboxylate transporter receptor subunit TctC
MQKNRRRIVGIAVALAACAGGAWAEPGEQYPVKPVKIIVPFPPGGLADILARGIAQDLLVKWGQPVLVDNRPGANTIIAAQLTARAPADGYTLLMANDPTLSSNQYLYTKLPYDPVKDLAPVINVAETLEILVAGPAFRGRSLADLVEETKAAPGRVSYGTYGLGSKAHLDAEAFAKAIDVKLLHVPYKGVADVVPALLGGQVQIAFTGVPPVAEVIKAGKLQALAIAASKRSALLPQVPTFAEVGLPNFHSSSWFGLVAPAGTPRPVIDKVAHDVTAIIVKPDFQSRYITGVGLELVNLGPEQFAEFLKKDRASYGAQIKALGVKLD